jgi:peptidoglycan/xylan/chitin deacetylase (PgdA/CDA1 family)/uncharacterized protein YraI
MAMNRRDTDQPRDATFSRRRFLAGTLGAAAMLAGGPHVVGAQSAATSLYRGPTGTKRVALTFDCGSDRGYADSILNTLASNGIGISFGMTGMWAEANPDLVRRMVNEGHHLMNHTYTHRSFTGLSTPGTGPLTYWQRREQIVTTNDLIVRLTGVSTKPYFRPPYGDFDSATLSLLGELGYSWNVMWTLDTLGWNGLTQSQIVNRVASNHGNGYIYLLHVGAGSQDGPALPQVIGSLRNLGYGFATVPGLLAGTGTNPTPPPAKFVAGDTVRVTSGLYLRTGPGFGYAVITTMPTGTTCKVVSGPTLANGLSWYQLDTPYGRGWAAGEYLERTSTTPPPTGFPAGTRVRVTAGLYLRTGPGLGYAVIVTMPTGTICTVVSGPQASGGYSWYQLDTPYGRGWAAGEFLARV